MKMRERVELGLIPAAVIAIGLSAPLLPVQLAILNTRRTQVDAQQPDGDGAVP